MVDPVAKPLITSVITIQAGESISDAADLTTGSMTLIISPPDWTPANITLLVSNDGSNYGDLFDTNGIEVLHPMGAGRAYLLDASLTQSALFVKIRSGPRDNPVPQEARREFKIGVSA